MTQTVTGQSGLDSPMVDWLPLPPVLDCAPAWLVTALGSQPQLLDPDQGENIHFDFSEHSLDQFSSMKPYSAVLLTRENPHEWLMAPGRVDDTVRDIPGGLLRSRARRQAGEPPSEAYSAWG